MTAHKARTGQLIVSYACKSEEHGECAKFLAELGDVIVCHCSCHPDDGCVATIRRVTKKQVTCPKCFIQHAGECY